MPIVAVLGGRGRKQLEVSLEYIGSYSKTKISVKPST